MVARVSTFLTLVLAASAATIAPRQETAAPKGKTTGGKGTAGAKDGKASKSGSGFLGGLTGGDNGGFFGLGGITASEIKGKEFECKNAALVFARGTGEMGNMGNVVGPGLGAQLKKALNGDILIQGADYTTDFSGGGAKDMVKTTQLVLQKCPNTKIVLGGYSQGAMQVHQALGQLGGDASKVAAAVTFGDPFANMGWGTGGLAGAFVGLAPAKGAKGSTGATASFNPMNGMIICSNGDFICGIAPNLGGAAPKGATVPKGSGSGGFGHLSYSSDGSIQKAVTFIVGKVTGTGASEAPAAGTEEPAASEAASTGPGTGSTVPKGAAKGAKGAKDAKGGSAPGSVSALWQSLEGF